MAARRPDGSLNPYCKEVCSHSLSATSGTLGLCCPYGTVPGRTGLRENSRAPFAAQFRRVPALAPDAAHEEASTLKRGPAFFVVTFGTPPSVLYSASMPPVMTSMSLMASS